MVFTILRLGLILFFFFFFFQNFKRICFRKSHNVSLTFINVFRGYLEKSKAADLLGSISLDSVKRSHCNSKRNSFSSP